MVWSCWEGRKDFFSEEKKQKTFIRFWLCFSGEARASG
jgi:hypothetical protein